jgi:hypothetical protein
MFRGRIIANIQSKQKVALPGEKHQYGLRQFATNIRKASNAARMPGNAPPATPLLADYLRPFPDPVASTFASTAAVCVATCDAPFS